MRMLSAGRNAAYGGLVRDRMRRRGPRHVDIAVFRPAA